MCAAAPHDAVTTDAPDRGCCGPGRGSAPSPAGETAFWCLGPPLRHHWDLWGPQAPEAASSAFSCTPESQGLKVSRTYLLGWGLTRVPPPTSVFFGLKSWPWVAPRPVRFGQKWAGTGGAEQQVRRPQGPPPKPRGYWGLLLNWGAAPLAKPLPLPLLPSHCADHHLQPCVP